MRATFRRVWEAVRPTVSRCSRAKCAESANPTLSAASVRLRPASANRVAARNRFQSGKNQ